MRTCFLNPSEFTSAVWKDNSYNLKKMSWNDNLQNNCLEKQFAKKMSGTTIPKNMARTTTDKKKVGQDNNLQKKLYRTTIYKKKSARTKVCRKRCPEHQFEKSCTERLFAKTSCHEQQYAEFAKKMTCHNYLLKLCIIYQVELVKEGTTEWPGVRHHTSCSGLLRAAPPDHLAKGRGKRTGEQRERD